MRHKGLCQGVDDLDVDGSAALDSSHTSIRVYTAGEVILHQGDHAAHVFTLISGWVALHRDRADGCRAIIQFLQANALFGTAPAGEPLSYGATAVTSASVCPIATAKLDDLRHQIPSLNERFIWLLEQGIHHQFEMLTTMGRGVARERIGTLLHELAAIGGDPASIATGAKIHVPLTQGQIAVATGLTAIHVNRVLRELREEGVLEFVFGALTVISPEKLRALVPLPGGPGESPAACRSP